MAIDWLDLFPEPMRSMLRKLPQTVFDCLEEVRIRENRPLEINSGGEHHFVAASGRMTVQPGEAYRPDKEDTSRLLDLISNHSLYTMEEELRKGFITIPGGHRIGLAGRAVLSGGKVEHLRDISGFNVRIARAILGIADPMLPYVFDERSGRVLHTLVLSPPQHGKTTLLRDLARQISTGTIHKRYSSGGMKVCIIDERSEIAGSYKGIPGFDVGPRTDVMDACPKAEGIMMMIRAMSPEVMVVDEIGRMEDAEAIQEALHAGISVIASAHGRDLSELSRRPAFQALTGQALFERYIVLERKGRHISFRAADAKQRMLSLTGTGKGGG